MARRLERKAGPYEKKTWRRAGKTIRTKYTMTGTAGWKLDE
jgi:hypothetical protein